MFETRCSWILKETSKNDLLTSPRPAWPVLQCLYLRLPASLNWDLSWAKYKLELRYVALNLAKPLNSMLCQRLGNHCGLVDYVLKPSFELVTCSCCSLNRRHLAAAPSKGHGDESRLNALNIHMWNVFWLRVKSEKRTLVAQTCQQSWKKNGAKNRPSKHLQISSSFAALFVGRPPAFHVPPRHVDKWHGHPTTTTTSKWVNLNQSII